MRPFQPDWRSRSKRPKDTRRTRRTHVKTSLSINVHRVGQIGIQTRETSFPRIEDRDTEVKPESHLGAICVILTTSYDVMYRFLCSPGKPTRTRYDGSIGETSRKNSFHCLSNLQVRDGLPELV